MRREVAALAERFGLRIAPRALGMAALTFAVRTRTGRLQASRRCSSCLSRLRSTSRSAVTNPGVRSAISSSSPSSGDSGASGDAAKSTPKPSTPAKSSAHYQKIETQR